jgi:hypothetical protein
MPLQQTSKMPLKQMVRMLRTQNSLNVTDANCQKCHS